MLFRWQADQLRRMPKVYSLSLTVDLSPGASDDHPVESDDGTEHFLPDVSRGTRNPLKARCQLRYGRDLVLVRLCTTGKHGNPDGVQIGAPHLHLYRESSGTKWGDVPAGVIEAFERYSVTARAWSSREELLDRLAS
ncbi:DUF6978 family protein [Saccharomonospora iraqiensis]|uniref:DUF6978 family protein n=1 Tax=Saccharomonospora iraqiensis TaxID=52698 RepID=UPI00389A3C50